MSDSRLTPTLIRGATDALREVLGDLTAGHAAAVLPKGVEGQPSKAEIRSAYADAIRRVRGALSALEPGVSERAHV